MLGWGVLSLIAWLLIAIWPAKVASRKGHGFWGWFFISIFFWWITLFWVYLGLKDRKRTAKDIAIDKEVEAELDREERG